MGLFDIFSKKQVNAGTLFDLQCELHPFRLAAYKNDGVDLEISLTNAHDQPLLTSITISVPRVLGMDRTGISHEREIRLGEIAPGASKRFKAGVFSNQKSAPGTYAVDVFASAHYRDYGHVLNQVRKRLVIRVE
ncbi:hypothetical protein HY994_04250 [Candidatus Micrarchaeota archaeon]|nr:hypothetical protein [Candidatus Micrarchaeota archaeon]